MVIFDGEHYAVVDTRVVNSLIVQDESFYSGFWNIATPELLALLKRHGESTQGFMGWSPDARAEEGVLEQGETLTAAGKAQWRNASEFRFKIPAAKVLHLTKIEHEGVYITDDGV
ncbi:MAG: hypothetical protein IT236_16640 [Bacteroidia bacterium]|nr:hypothetical protein [Bacteroidia bacterium]